MINQPDVESATLAAATIPPADGNYLENDYILSLMVTVLDYRMPTQAVVRANEFLSALTGGRRHRRDRPARG